MWYVDIYMQLRHVEIYVVGGCTCMQLRQGDVGGYG